VGYRYNYIKYYKKAYKELYGIDLDVLGGEFNVHHIDNNHDNDNINNLVLLPYDLHMEYHRLKNLIANCKIPDAMYGNIVSKSEYDATVISDYLDVLRRCAPWIDAKLKCDMYIQYNKE